MQRVLTVCMAIGGIKRLIYMGPAPVLGTYTFDHFANIQKCARNAKRTIQT